MLPIETQIHYATSITTRTRPLTNCWITEIRIESEAGPYQVVLFHDTPTLSQKDISDELSHEPIHDDH